MFLTIGLSPGIALGQAVIEEVTVTAQKREQSLQEVPVAVSAFTGDMLEAQGINQIEDLQRVSPSLSISQGINTKQSGLNIRGIGNNGVFSIQVEPAVLVVWDDVSLVQTGQAFSTMIDVERVEVLRGPQNTLFGKNASAGVISITSRSPAQEFEASVELTATDDEEEAGSFTVSGPISDQLGYRLTGYYSDREGYVENIAGGPDLHASESAMLRGAIQWSVSESLDITFNANYADSKNTCCSPVPLWWEDDAAFLVNAPLGILLSDTLPGVTMNNENLRTGRDDGDFQKVKNSGLSIKANWSLDGFDLTSITAINQWEHDGGNDIDFSGRDEPGDIAGLFSIRTWDEALRESDFISQELRLTTPVNESFDYLLGVYLSSVETTNRYQRYSEIGPFTSNTYTETETKTYAAFGQANWHLTAATSLSAGLRLNHEEISALGEDFQADERLTGDDDDTAVIGKLSLQHQLFEETMLYAGIATGYKGQAYDTAEFDEQKAGNPVKAENSINYELGVKTILADGKWLMNTAVFLTEYDDFQAQSVRLTDAGIPYNQLYNVGELETKGVELESTYIFNEYFKLSLAAAYIDAAVKDWKNAPCYALQSVAAGCDTIIAYETGGAPIYGQANAKGNSLNAVPEWKYTINADYRQPLGELPFELVSNINYTWQDDVSYDILGSPLAVQDDYGVTNLSLGIVEKEQQRYQLTMFVNNLFNEFYTSQISDGVSGQLYTNTVVTHIPIRSHRYAGLRLRLSW